MTILMPSIGGSQSALKFAVSDSLSSFLCFLNFIIFFRIFRRRRRCTVVHCMWSQWGAWSSCSVPCGTGGTSTRTRHVALLQQCGGFPCGGSSAETKPCNRFCNNGGKPLSKSCDCRGLPYYGTCCQTGG